MIVKNKTVIKWFIYVFLYKKTMVNATKTNTAIPSGLFIFVRLKLFIFQG